MRSPRLPARQLQVHETNINVHVGGTQRTPSRQIAPQRDFKHNLWNRMPITPARSRAARTWWGKRIKRRCRRWERHGDAVERAAVVNYVHRLAA